MRVPNEGDSDQPTAIQTRCVVPTESPASLPSPAVSGSRVRPAVEGQRDHLRRGARQRRDVPVRHACRARTRPERQVLKMRRDQPQGCLGQPDLNPRVGETQLARQVGDARGAVRPAPKQLLVLRVGGSLRRSRQSARACCVLAPRRAMAPHPYRGETLDDRIRVRHEPQASGCAASRPPGFEALPHTVTIARSPQSASCGRVRVPLGHHPPPAPPVGS